MSVAQALAVALEAVEEERVSHAAMLIRLAALAHAAVRLHELGDLPGCHLTCKEALDLAHVALGECEAFDPLCAALGYDDPAPGDTRKEPAN
jgi:hypothetical protein